jgi:hypothetical protein
MGAINRLFADDSHAVKAPLSAVILSRSAEEDRSGVIGPTTQRGHVRGARGMRQGRPVTPGALLFQPIRKSAIQFFDRLRRREAAGGHG